MTSQRYLCDYCPFEIYSNSPNSPMWLDSLDLGHQKFSAMSGAFKVLIFNQALHLFFATSTFDSVAKSMFSVLIGDSLALHGQGPIYRLHP